MLTNAGLLMSDTVNNEVTAGKLIEEARKACGMHIAALAVALKVPVKKLEALEADDYATLPDIVFVRALASSVCRIIEIDPIPVLSLLPKSPSPRLSGSSDGLNAPVKARFGKSVGLSASSFSDPKATSFTFFFFVLILLVGALALYYYPQHKEQQSSTLAAPVENVSRELAAAVNPKVPVESQPSPVAASMSSVQPVTDAPVLPVSSAQVPVIQTPASASSTPEKSSGMLVLRARSESWVQVRDSAGAIALQKNIAAGESVTVGAPTPMTVVIGRADVTEVTIRGKPFDLVPVTRENVARFEVK